MGTTPKGYPYPEGTDPVVDGDDAIQALAEAIDTKQPHAQAVGTAEFTGVRPGNAKSIAVTFPAGLFTANPYVTLGIYSTVPGEKATSHSNKSATGFTVHGGYTGASTSVDYRVNWHATQVAAPTAVNLLADEATAAAADATVTCPTDGCANEGIPIDISTHYVNEDDGTTQPVDAVQCGVCGADITATEEPTS